MGDSAIQQANSDRALLIENTITSRKLSETVLFELLNEVDSDKSGVIRRDEWLQAVHDERIWACLKALGVDADEDLWYALDRDHSSDVSIDEFVRGLAHLKGSATAIDMYTALNTLQDLD